NHYVLIDDKLRILSAVKKIWGERVTTVFPRQGHYALDPAVLAEYPPADIELASIGDLVNCDRSAFDNGLASRSATTRQRRTLERPQQEPDDPPAASHVGALPEAELQEPQVDAAGDRTVLIITGVSGSGKTTIATMLAEQLNWPFREGDDPDKA